MTVSGDLQSSQSSRIFNHGYGLGDVSRSGSMRPGRLPTRSWPISVNNRSIEVLARLHKSTRDPLAPQRTVCLKLNVRGCTAAFARLRHQQTIKCRRENAPRVPSRSSAGVATQLRHLQGRFDGAQVSSTCQRWRRVLQCGFGDAALDRNVVTRIFLPTLTSRKISSSGNAANPLGSSTRVELEASAS